MYGVPFTRVSINESFCPLFKNKQTDNSWIKFFEYQKVQDLDGM